MPDCCTSCVLKDRTGCFIELAIPTAVAAPDLSATTVSDRDHTVLPRSAACSAMHLTGW